RGWGLALVPALLIAAVAYLGQPKQDSPEHSSNSDAANGASAARLFAEAMGHPTSQIEGTFALPSSQGLIFVFTPTSAYSADDANQTAAWVRQGGVLVYASEQADPELDRAFSVTRYGGAIGSGVEYANPSLDGVTTVAGGAFASPFAGSAQRGAVLGSAGGPRLAGRRRRGYGA